MPKGLAMLATQPARRFLLHLWGLACVLLVVCEPVTSRAGAPSEADWALLPALFPELKSQMQELPPFVRDTELTLNFRTYYRNNEASPDTFQEAWAAGGWLAYRSGWLADVFSIGAIGYTSLPVYAPDDRDGTLLLKPGQEGFGVVGEAWAKLRYDDHVLTGYRQSVQLGYVNPQDNRMVPHTFEGAMLAGKFDWLQYTAGYLATIKPRNQNNFISMAEQAGATDSDAGLVLAGVRLAPWQPFWIEMSTAFGVDTFNTLFVQAEYKQPLTDTVSLALSAQYTDQRSVGSERVSSFDTWNMGVQAAVAFWDAIIRLAFHQTGEGANIQSPYGTWPGYLSLINKDFDRAGETAWGIRIIYNFTRLGVPGLSAFFWFGQGFDAIDPTTGGAAPNRREYDFDVTYAPPKGCFRGLSIQARLGLVDQEGVSGLLPDIRLILNYALPLL